MKIEKNSENPKNKIKKNNPLKLHTINLRFQAQVIKYTYLSYVSYLV